MNMLFGYGSYYYIIVALQAYCAFHSYRRGTMNKWIYVIVFLPVIGSLIYVYSEILSHRRFKGPNIDVGAVINPGGRIKKLEEELKFADTFANKIRLADAYLESGQTQKSIDLYKNSLSGTFAENEHVLMQLIVAYYKLEQYAEVIPLARRIYKLPQFPRSEAHILYAKSLEELGEIQSAENEFKLMKGRYSYYGPRYEYGLFLVRQGREEEAETIFSEMLDEESHLGQMEKRNNKQWFSKVREEMKSL